MPKLQITKDSVLLQEFDIHAERVTLGRDPENDIRLGDLTVSRRHGQLQRDAGGRYCIENLQGRNGIRLNGKEITQATALTDGDQLQIGVYRLHFHETPEAALLQQNHRNTGSEAIRPNAAAGTLPESAAALPTTVEPVQRKDAPRVAASSTAQAVEVGVLINEANNAIFMLDRDRVVLGNEGQVDIRVPGPERTRATIARHGKYFYLCSETPMPCVSVNGRPVMNARLLYNDHIEIGGRRFIFREI
ncbi:MAG: hypothetical protein ALAOOOJD_03347 [bacterium]|nr:hypothetical protein [bacterium]